MYKDDCVLRELSGRLTEGSLTSSVYMIDNVHTHTYTCTYIHVDRTLEYHNFMHIHVVCTTLPYHIRTYTDSMTYVHRTLQYHIHVTYMYIIIHRKLQNRNTCTCTCDRICENPTF